ncbi:MAG: hypothetical protein Q9160_008341 [Pyrenula sp. 1 TL-2023]
MDLLESSDSESVDGGVALNGDHTHTFKVNEDYAKRFEYNKKREELARLESKLGSSSRKRKRPSHDKVSESNSEADATSTSSESEDEDDAGELATETVDAEIQNALNAIRSKDPRVYDKDIRFYNEETSALNKDRHAQRKPSEMHLRDYHRETLLSNLDDGNEDRTDAGPLPYTHEQEALRKSIVGEINAAVTKDPEPEDGDDREEADSAHAFLSRKEKASKGKRFLPADLDVENADKDPETFLSNFMASRAWVPTAESKFQPFESDDEEEDRRAEEFEEAYNFRFEDPDKANEKLVSYARDTNQRYSVRRTEDNTRKRRRELEKQQKDIQKQEIAEEKARLRKLRVEEMEEKVRRIKRSAGLKSSDITDKDWDRFLNGDWNDEQWETEMQKRFGDEYYADDDFPSAEEGDPSENTKKRKSRKPKWDKDIEIDDLVPDFSAGDNAEFSLSDTDAHANEHTNSQTSARQNKIQQDRTRKEAKRQSRKDRQKVEQLVDEQLNLEPALLSGPSKKASFFQYRETSPTSFGLSAREILLAEDAQLNEYAGLKKLAAFRDPDKKKRDQKHLGKKARLRKWRKDTFGNENGPQEEQNGTKVPPGIRDVPSVDDVTSEKQGKRRRKTSKRIKASLEVA